MFPSRLKKRPLLFGTTSQEDLNSAKECAKGILKCIKEGKFWPPNEQLDKRMDEFADLFPDGIKKAVDGSKFENYKFNQE